MRKWIVYGILAGFVAVSGVAMERGAETVPESLGDTHALASSSQLPFPGVALPDEICWKIFSYLDAGSLPVSKTVSKEWWRFLPEIYPAEVKELIQEINEALAKVSSKPEQEVLKTFFKKDSEVTSQKVTLQDVKKAFDITNSAELGWQDLRPLLRAFVRLLKENPNKAVSEIIDAKAQFERLILQSIQNSEPIFKDRLPLNLLAVDDNTIKLLILPSVLILEGTNISYISPYIERLSQLQGLGIFNTAIEMLPPGISKLQNLQELAICGNPRLSAIPDCVFKLDGLQHLNLQSSYFTSLSSNLERMTSLRTLILKDNKKIKSLSNVNIKNLPNLKKLDLTGLTLSELPPSLGALSLASLELPFRALTLKQVLYWGYEYLLFPFRVDTLTAFFQLKTKGTTIFYTHNNELSRDNPHILDTMIEYLRILNRNQSTSEQGRTKLEQEIHYLGNIINNLQAHTKLRLLSSLANASQSLWDDIIHPNSAKERLVPLLKPFMVTQVVLSHHITEVSQSRKGLRLAQAAVSTTRGEVSRDIDITQAQYAVNCMLRLLKTIKSAALTLGIPIDNLIPLIQRAELHSQQAKALVNRPVIQNV